LSLMELLESELIRVCKVAVTESVEKSESGDSIEAVRDLRHADDRDVISET
jgi:hypothetical protein